MTDLEERVEPTAAPQPSAVRVRPATAADWSAAIAGDPLVLPEQSPEWVRAMCATTVRTSDVSRAYDIDGQTFVVPLVERDHRVASEIWSPLPAWGVGGIVGPTPTFADVAAIVDDLRSLDAFRVSVRIDARHEDAWQAAIETDDVAIARRSHIIELAATADEHLASLRSSSRRKIRRAERKGVEVEIDRSGALLATHHELFLGSVERWAEHQHEPARLALWRARRRDPLDKLHAMHDALGERLVTIVASVEGRPAASAIILLGATTRYTRGAMDRELAAPTNAAFAVQWAAIEAAYEYGSRRYHMGESGESDGISAFKEQFGAVAVDHHEYRFERLPITAGVDTAKGLVKRVIGFRDT